MIYIFIVPLDLSPDEAYYWDWSRRLDWGYYSKPPMIAWINWLSTFLLGNHTWAVRLPAALLSTTSILVIYLLAQKMFDKKAGLLAILALIFTPAASISALVMTIDVPLLFFWSLSLYSLWSAHIADKPSWWLLTGLFCGLGMLSKQTMVAFVPFSLLFLMSLKEGRNHLKRVWPYAAALVAFIIILPFLLWNAKHGWITFIHTSHHFEEIHKTAFLSFKDFFAFISSQALIFTPLTFLMFLLSPIALFEISKQKSLTQPYYFLICLGVLPLLLIMILSLKQTINANWPAPFYEAIAIMFGAACTNSISSHQKNPLAKIIKKFYVVGLKLGLIITIITLLMPFVIIHTPLAGSKLDPTKKLRGWSAFGRKIDKAAEALSYNNKLILIAKRRQTVSEMAFYCKNNPIVYQWPDSKGRIRSQYHLWGGPVEKIDQDALFVIQTHKKFPKNSKKYFEKIEFLGSLEIPLGPGGSRDFNLYFGKKLKGWP